jgi:CO dehydrogenase/acetyl-CoA synthase delta subunit
MSDFDEEKLLKEIIIEKLDEIELKDLELEKLRTELARLEFQNEKLTNQLALATSPIKPLLTQLLAAMNREMPKERADLRSQKLNEIIEKRKALKDTASSN